MLHLTLERSQFFYFFSDILLFKNRAIYKKFLGKSDAVMKKIGREIVKSAQSDELLGRSPR